MIIDLILLLILVICAIVAIQMRDLLSAIMLLTVYSLVMTLVWTRLNAVDVAFTEAAVGAGITTVLLIAALSRTQRGEEGDTKLPSSLRVSPRVGLVVVLLTGALLTFGTLDMPDYGDPNAPVNMHVAPYYIEASYHDTGVHNFVTAILASYRGYDTLGETTVIFTAGMGVILLLRRTNQRYKGRVDSGQKKDEREHY
ncbi:MAG: DUF4040 domain-containing protein [Desulforudis sp.]|jgi:multicomponent Na+:H+ antiporter subunit B|nr:DUF4040 domain-containing protein [Clostridia bacterium]RJX21358.1 MAG: DUF4040 domain-containing protein [Desulforudis sp.]